MRRWLIVVAGLNGLAAVTAGAAAQHLWVDEPARALADTAIRYGLPHAAALLALGALPTSTRKLARGLLAIAGSDAFAHLAQHRTQLGAVVSVAHGALFCLTGALQRRKMIGHVCWSTSEELSSWLQLSDFTGEPDKWSNQDRKSGKAYPWRRAYLSLVRDHPILGLKRRAAGGHTR